MMDQIKGLLTALHGLCTKIIKSVYGLSKKQVVPFMLHVLRTGSTWYMILALMPEGIRTEALARTDEMESLIAFMFQFIEGVTDFFNMQQLSKFSGKTVQKFRSLNKRIEDDFIAKYNLAWNIGKGNNEKQQDTNTMSAHLLAEKKLCSAIKPTQNCYARLDEVQRKEVHVDNISELVHKFAAFNAVKDGAFQLINKRKTESLTLHISGHGNSNEQVQLYSWGMTSD